MFVCAPSKRKRKCGKINVFSRVAIQKNKVKNVSLKSSIECSEIAFLMIRIKIDINEKKKLLL